MKEGAGWGDRGATRRRRGRWARIATRDSLSLIPGMVRV